MRAQSRSAAFGVGLFAAALFSGPAVALTGADLVNDVCLATYPRFEAAPDRMARFHGHSSDYVGGLFEQVDAVKRRSWTVSEEANASVDRFLVNIAWGTFQSRPAASCLVMDKGGMAFLEIKRQLALKEFRVRSEKVLHLTVADAIVERADGQRLWFTLTLAPGRNDPNAGSSISIVTLMSSDYLNDLMRKAP